MPTHVGGSPDVIFLPYWNTQLFRGNPPPQHTHKHNFSVQKLSYEFVNHWVKYNSGGTFVMKEHASGWLNILDSNKKEKETCTPKLK